LVSVVSKSKRKKVTRRREIRDDDWYSVKLRGRTLKELLKTQAIMQFYLERRVSFDEVLTAILEEAPKSAFGIIPQELLEKSEGKRVRN